MSNPVPPPGGAYPPPPGGAYPPAGQPPFPQAAQPPYGRPAQPAYGQPAQPPYGQPDYGQPSQPGGAYPPPPGGAPVQFGAFPGETKPKKSKKAVRVLAFLAVVVIGVIVRFGISSALDKDKSATAKVGDCVAAQGDVPKGDEETDTAAEKVDCTTSKAAFKVVGRVDGETNTKSKACDQYFTDEKADYFVYGSSSGSGFLLCLQALKPV